MSNADHSHDNHPHAGAGKGRLAIVLIMLIPSALTLGWVLHVVASGQ